MPYQCEIDAQNLVATAYEVIDPRYHSYINLIKQSRKVGKEPSGKDIYVWLELPYVNVAGRIAMAADEHAEVGKTIHYDVEFQKLDDHILCRSTVRSDIRGTGTGIYKVKFNSSNPAEQSNPFEVAETSAVGRALSKLGYGIITGVSSFEEVEGAIQEQSKQEPETPRRSTKVAEVPDFTSPNPVKRVTQNGDEPPASEKQIAYLKGLLSERGILKGQTDLAIAEAYKDEIPSRSSASADIEALKESDKLPPKFFNPYIMYLRSEAALSKDDVMSHVRKHFNKTDIRQLDHEEQTALIGWLAIGTMSELDTYTDDADVDTDDIEDVFDPVLSSDLAIHRIREIARVDEETAKSYLMGAFPDGWSSERRREKIFEISDKALRHEVEMFLGIAP